MTGLSVGAPFFPGGYGQPLAHGTDPANSRDNGLVALTLSARRAPFEIPM
jgi:hypothetical protein